MAGFPKGRRTPLVEGGVKAPPENASVQGGRRSPCREFTFSIFRHSALDLNNSLSSLWQKYFILKRIREETAKRLLEIEGGKRDLFF